MPEVCAAGQMRLEALQMGTATNLTELQRLKPLFFGPRISRLKPRPTKIICGIDSSQDARRCSMPFGCAPCIRNGRALRARGRYRREDADWDSSRGDIACEVPGRYGRTSHRVRR